jgi:hypothetical protein
VGFGRIVVLPYDASALVFNHPDAAMKVWRPFLAEVLWPPHTRNEYVAGKNVQVRYGTGNDILQEENWRAAAMETVIDRLGNVPGVGKFDFSYVAWVLLAMMIIVGPVDWFVLKKLGRQPWTWATISGWCVLITVGALYMGRVFKSGELHYRTLRVVEQDGDRVVAATEVAGIYTPKTAAYAVKGGDYLWWQPGKTDVSERFRQRQNYGTKFEFVQDRRGQQMRLYGENEPAMVVPIWNLRFMQGTDGQPGDAKPLIKAELTMSSRKGFPARKLSGSITNLTKGTMRNVFVWVEPGVAMATRPWQSPDDFKSERVRTTHNLSRTELRVGKDVPAEVAGGKAVTLDGLDVQPVKPEYVFLARQMSPSNRFAYYGGGTSSSSMDVVSAEMEFIRAAAGLRPERTRRVLEMFERREPVACVFAEVEVDGSEVKLVQGSPMPAKERHWQVVRAIVPLKLEER